MQENVLAIKRSIYLINPKFQIKFSLFVCSLIFVSSLIYPFTIYELVNSMLAHKAFHASKEFLQASRLKLILTLFAYQFGFISIVFIICIFQSHKIAGPLYKIRQFLGKIKNGEVPGKIFFRKGDHFHELATDLNDAFFKLEKTHFNDLSALEYVKEKLITIANSVPDEKKYLIKEISEKIDQLQSKPS